MLSTARRLIGLLSLSALAAVSLPAHAGPYSGLYIFGDSLSDTGNLFLATGGAQPPAGQPYYQGRFSNGLVWVDHLAAGLGLAADAAPSLAGGNNYAFAGARTGASGNPPGVLAQVAGLYAPTHPTADAGALYVVVGGGNDMRDARGAAGTDLTRQAAAEAAVANLMNSVGLLAGMGARHVLISNLPDLGATPEAALLGLTAQSHDVSVRFNSLVSGLEQLLEGMFAGLDVDVLDMAGLSASIVTDAQQNGGAQFGITNVSSPCAGFTFSTGTSCDVSLFSDALHPSARAHQVLGQAALALVIPEPGMPALVAVALVGLALTRRRAAA